MFNDGQFASRTTEDYREACALYFLDNPLTGDYLTYLMQCEKDWVDYED
jgi:hypothetical protein